MSPRPDPYGIQAAIEHLDAREAELATRVGPTRAAAMIGELRGYLEHVDGPAPDFVFPGEYPDPVCGLVHKWTPEHLVSANLRAAREHAIWAAVFCTGCMRPVWAYELPGWFRFEHEIVCEVPAGTPHTHTVWAAELDLPRDVLR